ncbi:MAG: SDR family NAD(P)-dependent oxidoreductase [Gammaproteobacteria bacterium]|nr:SDR family NAD(P)-dependent oxidoreductase [Gammaproteobacteria bacterium]
MARPESTNLIIGASSTIAKALIAKIGREYPDEKIIAISRSAASEHAESERERIEWLISDYSEQSMSSLSKEIQKRDVSLNRIFICNGILHDEEFFPEKRLKDISLEVLHKRFAVNAFQPVLWLKHLIKSLPRDQECVVTVFSARVGSIDDNNHGGWYSYRASKAALNMLIKTAAIECRRFAKNIKFLAFHPGTTDTPLSAPFQKDVPAGKLFSADFVADQLLKLVHDLPAEPYLNFLDWKGDPVAW